MSSVTQDFSISLTSTFVLLLVINKTASLLCREFEQRQLRDRENVRFIDLKDPSESDRNLDLAQGDVDACSLLRSTKVVSAVKPTEGARRSPGRE